MRKELERVPDLLVPLLFHNLDRVRNRPYQLSFNSGFVLDMDQERSYLVDSESSNLLEYGKSYQLILDVEEAQMETFIGIVQYYCAKEDALNILEKLLQNFHY